MPRRLLPLTIFLALLLTACNANDTTNSQHFHAKATLTSVTSITSTSSTKTSSTKPPTTTSTEPQDSNSQDVAPEHQNPQRHMMSLISSNVSPSTPVTRSGQITVPDIRNGARISWVSTPPPTPATATTTPITTWTRSLSPRSTPIAVMDTGLTRNCRRYAHVSPQIMVRAKRYGG